MVEMTPEQAQSKFTLTQTLLPPAKCVFCGRSRQEAMVTANLFIEFYGQVYICVGCSQEIAVVVEYGPVAELLVAQAALLAKEEEIVSLEKQLEEEQENVRVLTRITSGSSNSNDSDDSASDTPDPVVVEAESEPAEKPKPRPRAGKVVSPKSSDRSSESSAG